MSNVVNFSDLKRKEIRKELSDGVVVYNPSPEQKKKIIEIIAKYSQNGELNISPEDVLLTLIPMLSNIKLNLDKERDKDKIDEILQDPSELLEDVEREIKDIVKKVGDQALELAKEMKDIPPEKLDKIINIKTKEDEEIETLEKRLLELKNKK